MVHLAQFFSFVIVYRLQSRGWQGLVSLVIFHLQKGIKDSNIMPIKYVILCLYQGAPSWISSDILTMNSTSSYQTRVMRIKLNASNLSTNKPLYNNNVQVGIRYNNDDSSLYFSYFYQTINLFFHKSLWFILALMFVVLSIRI